MPETLIAHINVEGIPTDICLSTDHEYESFDVMVYCNFYTANRDCVNSQDFGSHEAAMKYCREKYGITDTQWKPIPQNNQIFEFTSHINDYGVPQMTPVESDGKLRIHIYDNGGTKCIDLAGDTDGLRTLAKHILLATENCKLDRDWHHHLSFSHGVELTLRGPGSALVAQDNLPEYKFT